MKPQTVIGKAKELVESEGKEAAIAFFQDKINEMGQPKNFEQTCRISGWQTAIDYINGKFDNPKK